MSLTGFTRTRVAPDHALLTPDTFVRAPLPGWKNTACIVHVSPELGARFKMYTVEMEPRGSGEMTLLDIQRFAYVLEGAVALEVGGTRHTLGAHHYAYLPANTPHRFEAASKARMVVFEKPYQALAGLEVPSLVLGHEPDIPSSPLLGDEALQVRLLLPDSFSFDMAVNTMTFAPGGHLPFVETHVMEHGLFFLEGGGGQVRFVGPDGGVPAGRPLVYGASRRCDLDGLLLPPVVCGFRQSPQQVSNL